MTDLLQFGVLVPTGTAACCVAADRRRSFRSWVPAIVMLLAVVDELLPTVSGFGRMLPGVVWVLLLIASAFVSIVPKHSSRRAGGPDSGRAAPRGATPMPLQRALGCIGMAALVLGHQPAGPVSAHHNTFALLPLGALAIAAYGAAVALIHWRRSRLDAVDAASMSLSILVMVFARMV